MADAFRDLAGSAAMLEECLKCPTVRAHLFQKKVASELESIAERNARVARELKEAGYGW